MKLKRNMILGFMMGCFGVSHAYLQTDLDQFEATNQCNECDLTQMVLQSKQHNNAQLTKAFLDGTSIKNLVVNDSNFYSSRWVYVILDGGEFNQSNFSSTRWSYALAFFGSFKNANFQHAVFDNARLIANDYANADFTYASFEGADVAYSNFYNSNITAAQFAQMRNFTCATLPDGTLYDNYGSYSCEPPLRNKYK